MSCPSRLLATAYGSALLSFSANLFAHGLAMDSPRTTALDAAVVGTWRSAAAVDDNTAWRMPGFLMGGESWPVDEGVSLDEVNLSGQYAIDPNVYAVAKAGIHSGGKGSDHGDTLEVQHAYLGWRNNCAPFCTAVEAGKMSALFSPAMAEHASTRLLSESSLLLDTLFGRDFHDQGARILWQSPWGISGGVEHWRGQAFPSTATDDGGNNDIFIRYDFHSDTVTATLGGWAMRADAENRIDHRYSADHSHGNNTTPLFPSVGFTGATDLQGLHASARWQLSHLWALSVSGEWMNADADGFLQNNQRTADLRSQIRGYWVQPAIHWRTHTLALRSERLQADNYLEGAGAPALTLDSGLSTNGYTPERLSLVWLWQWKSNLALRVEAVDDRSLPDDASRMVIGIVWRQNLWRAK
ncbi:hypothetical protein CBP51_19750 [Cellvibrio mixtus]|uniref:Porin n=1 Tax=Cellvibrio mixtus TaxID=39650 RepID=A0A266Q2P9_9GAMM|nr:hypothetical protein [Cellvibrio mixtus]OZY83639.1 hypothetical protein CBP51_19750 [Cellvibrio mixtus]